MVLSIIINLNEDEIPILDKFQFSTLFMLKARRVSL